MKNYWSTHPWQVIEEGFHEAFHEVSESVCSLGNGRFGLRGNFEEAYSGKSLRGSYFAGVYYPDLTRVGWWKNGYPEYFAKVLNGVNWIGINIWMDGVELDLHKIPATSFRRILDMEHGLLIREFEIKLSKGSLSFRFERFCNMADADTAAIRISIQSNGFDGEIKVEPYLDFDVHNKDTNYGDQFWSQFKSQSEADFSMVSATTKKTHFDVSALMSSVVRLNEESQPSTSSTNTDKRVSTFYTSKVTSGNEVVIEKYVTLMSSLYVAPDQHAQAGLQKLNRIVTAGYDAVRDEHIDAWKKIWDSADIRIEGNDSAQQGIRFNIFQLWQTYTGEDARMNIGPKGFTGEKYGGSTYWDTEAYCIPFYLGTADPQIARNLLVYRYLHLPKAIENAKKLGFKDGAALYPMVTINGEECHNEWEITFEEIHRNGAIVYAIYDYIRYTDDTGYLLEGGLEVMIGVARFWAQRFNYSQDKKAWVMLGVTGPNEYENNVNNNWYTSRLAIWTLGYTQQVAEWVKAHDTDAYARVIAETKFDDADECARWNDIVKHLYLGEDKMRGVFIQQDGFLDKDLMPVKDLSPEDRPLNQKWSWDRILRSCFIKQADVLQGLTWRRFAAILISMNP